MAPRRAAAATAFALLLGATALAAASGLPPLGGAPLAHPVQQPQGAAASSGRRLKQLTVYASTPTLASSTTAAVDVGGRVGPDGTLHGAAGIAATTAAALSNRLLKLLTLGGYPNRPEAATAAYVASPLVLESTLRPTQTYGLGEARGDLASAALGGWAAGEVGFNPAAGNLGASLSGGTANSFNILRAEELVEGSALLDPGYAGVAGVEFAGTADDQTRLGDARTAQLGDAIAYPFSLASPINPLQCTQVLTYGLALAKYDPTASPGGPLPDGSPLAAEQLPGDFGGDVDDVSGGATVPPIPFCLSFFNLASLDDFAALQESGAAPEAASPSAAAAAPPPASRTAPEAQDAGKEENRTAAGGLPTFEQQLTRAVNQADPAANAFLTTTPAGEALLAQIQASPVARSLDNGARAAAGLAGAAAAKLRAPLQNLSESLAGLGAAAGRGAANFGLQAGAEAARAAAPLLVARANASRDLGGAVSEAGARLAARSFDSLMKQVAALPDAAERAEAERLLAPRAEAAARSGGGSGGAGGDVAGA